MGNLFDRAGSNAGSKIGNRITEAHNGFSVNMGNKIVEGADRIAEAHKQLSSDIRKQIGISTDQFSISFLKAAENLSNELLKATDLASKQMHMTTMEAMAKMSSTVDKSMDNISILVKQENSNYRALGLETNNSWLDLAEKKTDNASMMLNQAGKSLLTESEKYRLLIRGISDDWLKLANEKTNKWEILTKKLFIFVAGSPMLIAIALLIHKPWLYKNLQSLEILTKNKWKMFTYFSLMGAASFFIYAKLINIKRK